MEAPAPTVQLRAGIADLLDIRQLPQRVLLAEDLWSTTPYLLRAWEVATPQEWACPRFHLALSRSGREPHWFELIALPEGPGPLTPPTVVAKAHALTCVSHRPEFAWDASLVSYAVHGHWRDLEASLCVTAAKADAPFTETGLGPWTAFAQRALPALIRQAVTWCGLAERREAECPATPTPTYDIFLSHSSIDSVKARIIYNKATALNLRVYFSPVDLEPGQRFSEELRQALVASAEVWLLASEASLASVWVHTEWGAAWVLQKKIVPILYRIGPSKLPDRLQELQVVDLDSIDEPLKQLAQASNRQAKAAGR